MKKRLLFFFVMLAVSSVCLMAQTPDETDLDAKWVLLYALP